jgi:hypothetical protein
MSTNLTLLVDATKKIWERLQKKFIVSGGVKRPLNGNIGMILGADDLDIAEKTVLRQYLNTTRNIAGCQAVRARIGHCLFGMRVAHGECIFVTLSPHRLHGAMLLKLSRARRRDTSFLARDSCTRARQTCCGVDEPPIFFDGFVHDSEDAERATATLKLPCLDDRRGLIARDPLSSVHQYLICLYVLLPAAFGIRMCSRCPHCNVDEKDPDFRRSSAKEPVCACQDIAGHSTKPMGGYAGLAAAMAFATEFQGNGTPHGHGFVALCNIYQNGSLQDVADHIARQASSLSSEEAVQRISSFVEHLHREDHYDNDKHEAAEPELEKQFMTNCDGPRENVFLSARSRGFYEAPATATLWDAPTEENRESREAQVRAEAQSFKERYEADVQFIFSNVQQHWHPKDAKGVRQPTKYCRLKGNVKKAQFCKQHFPMHVCRKKDGKTLDESKYRVRVVCKGVAAELKLKSSGRRNMLGMVMGRRTAQLFQRNVRLDGASLQIQHQRAIKLQTATE